MRRRRSPILSDVKYGTPSGLARGRFVMNDGEAVPIYNASLLQENRLPLLQENGLLIYLS